MKAFLKNNPQALFLFAFSIILYANTISHDYSFDDEYVAVGHKLTSKGFSGIDDIFTSPYITTDKTAHGYRPVSLTTFAVEHQFFSGNPHISHVINVLLYATCIMVLFLVLLKLFHSYASWFVFMAVLLFAAHPMHTEVVASIKNRDEVLSMLCALLSIHTLLTYYDTSQWSKILLSGLFFLLALLSKESAMIYLTVFPMVGYFYLTENYRKLWIPTLVQVLVFFGVLGILFLVFPEFNAREIEFHENPSTQLNGYLEKIPYGFYVYLLYLKNLLFPYQMSFYYGYNEIPLTGWSHLLSLFSLILHLGLAAFAVKMFRQKHIAAFAICFYAMAISPMNNITTPTPGIMADRLTFTASLGFCIVWVYALVKMFKEDLFNANRLPLSVALKAVFTLFLVVFSIKTILRNQDWKDKYTIITTDIENVHQSTKAHVAAASIYMEQIGKSNRRQDAQFFYTKAEQHAKKAIEIYPEMMFAHDLLGLLYYKGKRYGEAEKYLLQAMSLDSTYINPILNLAKTKYMTREFKASLQLYQRALALDRQNPDALANSSLAYYKIGDIQQAIQANLEAIAADPTFPDAYLYLSSLYIEQGNLEKGIAVAEKGLENCPNAIQLCQNLVNYYSRNGNKEKYQYYYGKLKELQKKK